MEHAGLIGPYNTLMSRHIPRSARWSSLGPNEHRSAVGRVYYRTRQWWAEVTYQLAEAGQPGWQPAQTWSLGRFKRPRNAMMAVEHKVQELRSHHGDQVRFLDWTRTQPMFESEPPL